MATQVARLIRISEHRACPKRGAATVAFIAGALMLEVKTGVMAERIVSQF
jgi:hypothetical protein